MLILILIARYTFATPKKPWTEGEVIDVDDGWSDGGLSSLIPFRQSDGLRVSCFRTALFLQPILGRALSDIPARQLRLPRRNSR